MNKPAWFKKVVIPIIASIGNGFPNIPSPEGLKEGYAKSIHNDHHGEWDFSLDNKPILGFKINLGWIAAIHYAQKKSSAWVRYQMSCTCDVFFEKRNSW